MDYIKPDQVVESMVQAGITKAKLGIKQLLIRGLLSAALLGVSTTLAFSATVQTKVGMTGAILFPVGFVMIVLLGLEIVTGNFALVPLAVIERKATIGELIKNWFWVFVGHLGGAVLYGMFYWIAVTKFGHINNDPVGQMIMKAAEAKTTGYSSLGFEGMVTVFVKAMLCNWMVCLGAVMAMTSQSTLGKIVAMWLPVMTFFGQGFEHSVVNMFVIPTGMMFGAKVSFADWWLWNQIPVTLGNIVGGLVFTGIALYWTQRKLSSSRSIAKEAVGAVVNQQ